MKNKKKSTNDAEKVKEYMDKLEPQCKKIEYTLSSICTSYVSMILCGKFFPYHIGS